MIRTLDARTLGADAVVAALERSPEQVAPAVHAAVDEILAAVRARGDDALVEYTARFDGFVAVTPGALAIGAAELDAADRAQAPETRAALAYAAERIERYHAAALSKSWRMTDEHGSVLGQEVRPLDRVGIYIPGGRAAYPSTVLMTAIPARVAGVREIVLVTPPGPDGRVNEAVLAAARVAGVTEGWRIGGAQAIAALAYGTATIRRVDKIVGPGNIYVACAKRFVFGAVDIDSIAGPSEILVVCDETADARVVAADLLSQAEHDEAAYPLLVAHAREFVSAVERELASQLATLPRAAIARASIGANGHAFVASTRERMAHVADRLASEHLSLQVKEARALLKSIPRAGAAFVGHLTPEAAGDYLAGPSHVLPTGGSVRFGSPLGVYDFVTRTSLIEYTPSALRKHAKAIVDFASLEGLAAHARAVDVRIEPL